MKLDARYRAMHLSRTLAAGGCTVLALLGSQTAQAQPAYPAKPVRLIVPLPPGGAADLVGRTIGQKLAEATGQQFVIENRTGAGANIGPALVSKATADGYTLLLASVTNHAVAVQVYPDPGYDLVKSFTPIALLANAPHLLVAHPSLPVKTVRDVIALAKQRPNELGIGSQGSGTLGHLEIVLLQAQTGIAVTHVPYKGSAPAKADLTGGHIQLLFDSYASSSQLIREGRARAIAFTSEKRSGFMPDLPTLAESGLKEYAANNWYGMMAPAGTPKPIIDKLAAEIAKALQLPDTRERYNALGLEMVSGGPERLAEVVLKDLAIWGPVVKRAKVTVD